MPKKEETISAIKSSPFLTKNQKRRLATFVPKMTIEQLKKLMRILGMQKKILEKVIGNAVKKSIGEGDATFLKSLRDFLSKSNRKILKTQIKKPNNANSR